MAEQGSRWYTGGEENVFEVSPEGAEETVMHEADEATQQEDHVVVHVDATEDVVTFTHKVLAGHDVRIHGHHYDVGTKGYHWTFEWPNGTQGEHNTEDVTFFAGSVGVYRLRLPVVRGEVIIDVIAE